MRFAKIITFFGVLYAASSFLSCSNSDFIDDTLISDNPFDNEPVAFNSLITTPKEVEPGKLIPSADFSGPFVLYPPQTQDAVRCTFDGSEPDSTTPIFSEEILIDSTTVARCVAFKNGIITQQQTETYFINEDINMPVVSISVAPNYVQDYLDAKPCSPNPCKSAKFWEDVEYPTHVEYFAEGSLSKKKAFEIEAGISIAGNYSRNQEKKTVAITMRKEYQEGRLLYPLFETRPEHDRFKSFVLRNNGNRFKSDYIADAMATSLLEGTNVDYQRSRQVIVFYNGDYRGIYDMREKLNEHFVETNYGISHKNVDLIKITNLNVEIQNGSADEYINLMHFLENHNFMDNNVAYKSVSQMIDIPNFMEYMAAEIYYANDDWPHNNVRAWKNGNSPWKFIAFDIDHGFDWSEKINGFTKKTSMLNWTINEEWAKTDYRRFHNTITKLIKNPDFKQAFINRASYLYSTFINSQKINQKIDYINSTIDKAQFARDQKKYNRPKYTNVCGTGFETDGSCLKKWSATRDKTVRNEFKDYFNLNNEVPITIEIKGNGTLKLDGFDIKQSSKYNWTVFENHPMKLSIACPNSSTFKAWENGSSNSIRTIKPRKNAVYTAECQ